MKSIKPAVLLVANWLSALGAVGRLMELLGFSTTSHRSFRKRYGSHTSLFYSVIIDDPPFIEVSTMASLRGNGIESDFERKNLVEASVKFYECAAKNFYQSLYQLESQYHNANPMTL